MKRGRYSPIPWHKEPWRWDEEKEAWWLPVKTPGGEPNRYYVDPLNAEEMRKDGNIIVRVCFPRRSV